jgi:hypothetical protein
MSALRIAFLLFCLLFPFGGTTAQTADLYVFYGEGCPHCAEQHTFLDALERAQPGLVVHRLEVWRTDQHHEQFRLMAAAHGIDANSVPTVFGFGRVWVGHSPQIAREIEAAAGALSARSPAPSTDTRVIRVPGLGEIDLAGESMVYGTLLIAFVDGFNPCSFWVLTLLLGLVVHSGSRGRVVLVGGTFLLTTTLVYGLFIAGIFSVLGFVIYLDWVQWLVAAFALVFGVVGVKDYFLYKRGISFTISDRHKPAIYRNMRHVMARKGAPWAMVSATVLMALGIALVELPCTAGFPVLWSAMLAERGVHGHAFAGLLALYLLVYLLDELVVFVVAVTTLRIGRFEERHGRLLKLIGGSIMLALAVTLIVRPQLMHVLSGSLAVFGGAMAAALVVHLVWWRVV